MVWPWKRSFNLWNSSELWLLLRRPHPQRLRRPSVVTTTVGALCATTFSLHGVPQVRIDYMSHIGHCWANNLQPKLTKIVTNDVNNNALGSSSSYLAAYNLSESQPWGAFLVSSLLRRCGGTTLWQWQWYHSQSFFLATKQNVKWYESEWTNLFQTLPLNWGRFMIVVGFLWAEWSSSI